MPWKTIIYPKSYHQNRHAFLEFGPFPQVLRERERGLVFKVILSRAVAAAVSIRLQPFCLTKPAQIEGTLAPCSSSTNRVPRLL